MMEDLTADGGSFDRAVGLHEAGRFADAITIYEQILAAEGEDAPLLELLGAAFVSLGEFGKALQHLDRSIALDPSSPSARHQRGVVLERLGRTRDAAEDYRIGLDLNPSSTPLAERLGVAQLAMGETSEAWTTFSKALSDAPGSIGLLIGRADASLSLGRYSDAEFDIDRILSGRVDDPIGLILRARLLICRGRAVDAVEIARKALVASNRSVESRLTLVMALANSGDRRHAEEAIETLSGDDLGKIPDRLRQRLLASAEIAVGRPKAALDRLDQWLLLDPNDSLAWGVRASAERGLHMLGEAMRSIERALEIDPDAPSLRLELGRLLLDRSDADGAIRVFEKEIELGRSSRTAWLGMIEGLAYLGRTGQAVRLAEEALREHPADPDLAMYQVKLLHDVGRHREAVEAGRLLARTGQLSPAQSSRHLFGLQYPDHVVESELVQSHLELGGRLPRLDPRAPKPSREEGRALRIGFVSSDLKAHSVAWFLRPLLRHLDRSRVRTFAYSNTRGVDVVTDSLCREFAEWRMISGCTDDHVADLVADDRIDILIDLSGHTGENRLGIFRASPAPVQVTWLGYPNTTGVPEIGWRIVDELTDPAGTEAFASESLLRMRSPFLCFDPDFAASDIPVRPDRAIVFGSFNNAAKLSDRCFDLWSRTLKAVPDSRLLVKSRGLEDPEVREWTHVRLEKAGVHRSRVELVGFTPGLGSHHLAYSWIDIALDTFPYHGTTTTCEALWNGVPVVSRIGDVHRARVGKTLLQAVGLPELACDDDESFVQAAATLASDTARRRALHAELRDRMRRSPLCDGPGFARRFEGAIRHAWRCWCRGEAPAGVFLSDDA